MLKFEVTMSKEKSHREPIIKLWIPDCDSTPTSKGRLIEFTLEEAETLARQLRMAHLAAKS